MRRYFLPAAFGVLTAACTVISAGAQSTPPVRSDVLIRIEQPVTVAAADTIGTLIVIGNDATVIGTVRNLVVINGTARVSGTVQQNLVIISGAGELAPTAFVGKDVLLYKSTLAKSSAARVVGAVHNEVGLSFSARALWLLWLSVTVAMVAAGLVSGYFAAGPLAGAADGLRSDWRGSLITALIIICGLPAAAVLSFMTGIGFVFGLFIFFMLIPVLSLIGYLVAATALGRILLGLRQGDASNTYSAIGLGMLLLQVMTAIPVIGLIVVIVSSQVGAGALVYRAWKREHSARIPPHVIIQPA